MSVVYLTDDNFKKEVLESDLPVLVDYWADWCAPCKMIGLIIDEAARDYEGKVKVGKINIDENSRAATDYGVMSIPTLIFFKKGRVIDQVSGVLSKAQLKKKIEANI